MQSFTKSYRFITQALLMLVLISLVFTSCTSNVNTENQAKEKEVLSKNIKDNISTSAKSAIAIEVSSGEVYYAKNENARLPMASTTKIMTALVAIESFDIDKTVHIKKEAVGIEGSSVYLFENEEISMRDLLYALLLNSANDAAVAIALEVGGSIENFSCMMNKRAKSLGLSNTNFENPHGLDSENHYTTAYDLAIITREAMKNDTFCEIISTRKKTSLKSDGNTRLFINHNKLLSNYDGAIGVKTGFTKKSGRCLVSAAERDGVKLICVTLNAPDDWNDHKSMLDLGFSIYESISLYKASEYRFLQSVTGGKDLFVLLTNESEISFIKRKNDEYTVHIELPYFSYAPINKGDTIGYMYIKINGKIIDESKLYAIYSVERK